MQEHVGGRYQKPRKPAPKSEAGKERIREGQRRRRDRERQQQREKSEQT